MSFDLFRFFILFIYLDTLYPSLIKHADRHRPGFLLWHAGYMFQMLLAMCVRFINYYCVF